MEIHQLKYFIAVVETGNFSRAAQRCNIAQPSLSQQIIKLEQELGQPLFHRLGRKVILSNAGQAFLPSANAILAELQSIKQNLPDVVGTGHGSLSVGFIPTISPFVLPRVVQIFQQTFPNASLSVQEDSTDALVRDLLNGRLDVGIMSLPINNKLIRTELLLTEPLVAAASHQYGLSTRAFIRVKDLADFPFIALNETDSLGEQVKEFCYQQHVNLKVVCHPAQLSTLQSCLALGLGISLVPQALALQDGLDGIVYRPISDVVPQRKIVAATHSGRNPSFLLEEFVRMVREEYPTEQMIRMETRRDFIKAGITS